MRSSAVHLMKEDAKPMGKRFRRRNYFINKPFQLAFAGNMLLIAAVGMAATALAVSWIFIYVLDDHLCATCLDNHYLLKIGIILVCMAVGIFIWTVIRTHAIVGPIDKTRKILREAAEGRFPNQPVAFRRGDAFQDLAEDLNRCLDVMRKERERR